MFSSVGRSLGLIYCKIFNLQTKNFKAHLHKFLRIYVGISVLSIVELIQILVAVLTRKKTPKQIKVKQQQEV